MFSLLLLWTILFQGGQQRDVKAVTVDRDPPAYVLSPEQSARRKNIEQVIIKEENLEHVCQGIDKPKLLLDGVHFAGLTEKNKKDMVVNATTCAMGNGGSDILRVFTLRNGQEINVPIQWPPDKYFKDTRGRMWLDVEKGKLIARLPFYKATDLCNACVSGHRTFVLKYSRGSFRMEGEPKDTPFPK